MHVLAAPGAHFIGDIHESESYVSYMIIKSLAQKYHVRFTALTFSANFVSEPPTELTIIELDRPFYERHKCKKEPVPLKERLLFPIKYALPSIKVLRTEKVDLIHHFSPSISREFSFNPLALMGITKKYPFVVGPVYDLSHSIRIFNLISFKISLLEKTLENCDTLIASTHKCKQLYSKILDPKKIVVIPIGVDTELFTPKSKKRYNEPIKLLGVGRIEKRKGFDILLRALKKVIISGVNNVMLEIVGSGKYKPYCEWLAKKLGIDARVVFRDYVPHEKIVEYFGECDIFIHPALYESFGMVVLEAMACGKPVIVTNTCGVAEAIEHGRNGLLVPPADMDSLANAILNLIHDESLREKLGKAARHTIENKYSWECIADEYYQVYSRVI